MKEYIYKLFYHWRILLRDYSFRLSCLAGIFIFALGYSMNKFASISHDGVDYEPVGDLILNFLPTYNLEYVFVWGFYILIALTVLYPLFFRPEIGPFLFKTFGILLFVRAGFIVLTHVGPPEGFFYGDGFEFFSNPISNVFFRNDLFFSGHVSVPFLAFLILKDTKFKWLMLFGSILMAFTVLLMHIHYSIDVFSAFFITHGVYAISNKIFNDLNKRFKLRLKRYGWATFKKRLLKKKFLAEKFLKIRIKR
ncbi:hypothetical protein HY604_00690 [Candidatus Peregrinibacteria bacterium]|nr:hypothetical protein [Candidatus Peregrinibacteria bacterium]